MFNRYSLIALLAFVTSAAFAQDGMRGSKQEQQACSRDVTRYCRKQMGGSDNSIQQCLKQNRESLTRACRKALEDHGQ